jgi:hypothetical protein
MWDTAHAPWLSSQNASLGAQAAIVSKQAIVSSLETRWV